MIVDVGAAFLGEAPPYQPLVDAHLARRYAFEPNEVSAAELRTRLEAEAVVLPYALADGCRHTLHLAPGGMTSLLEPDPAAFAFLTPFSMAPFWPVERGFAPTVIETRRLDDITEIPAIDYLKIDVQGAELLVIENGREKLESCSVVHVEMSFFALYKDQPLFGEVDAALRAMGFVVHGLADVKRYPVAPFEPRDLWRGLNQLVEVDMVYVRDLKRLELQPDAQLAATALIMDTCYASYDIALRCLAALEKRGVVEAGLTNQYRASIGASHCACPGPQGAGAREGSRRDEGPG